MTLPFSLLDKDDGSCTDCDTSHSTDPINFVISLRPRTSTSDCTDEGFDEQSDIAKRPGIDISNASEENEILLVTWEAEWHLTSVEAQALAEPSWAHGEDQCFK